ncbi:MAG: HEAT repeat domain-containing protein [Chlorobi bacterium]|nr:HEAT repeat domain-containing protein [Chlorobiota bacterium]
MILNSNRLVRGILVPWLVLTIFPLSLLAQSFFPDYVERGLDSALSSILMTRYDLAMNHDAAGDDIHRLSEIKRMFSEPLRSFTVPDSVALVGGKSHDEPLLFFRHIRSLLDLGTNFPTPARIVVKDREIDRFGRFDINALNYTEQLVLRRYVALAIATDVMITRNRAEIDPEQFNQIISFCDSLILQSEETAETDLITMRYKERYALERAKRFFNTEVAPIDYAKLLSPGTAMYVQALDYVLKMEPEVPGYYKDVRTSVWESPLGLIAIGGSGDDVYRGDFFCIVDIGGNDVYRATPKSKTDAAKRGTTLIIDFSGDDTYIGEDYVFGGTLFGASTLIDLDGDDSYTARNFSLGTGYFGVGVLHDRNGSDRYKGGTAVQGAGLFGIGLISEGSGNDLYHAHMFSQGFGYTRGIGTILEIEGNDQYISASPYQDFLRYDDHYESFCQGAASGYRPVASGGYGIIADAAGSDLYSSDIYGQGTAYWYGLGSIVDSKGNDHYISFQYAQGSGVHLAFGSLIDKDGNDNYVSHGVSQGCGHDIAFGGLYDLRGEDNYVVESLSLGGGNADAISLFIDAGGEDGYIARHDNTLGFSDLRRNYGMIGIFLDLDGDDFYGTSRGGNDSVWLGSTYGAGMDAGWKPEDIKEPEKPQEEIEKELEDDLEKLFIQASAAPQKYQYLVEPARKRLEENADTTIPFLLSKLDSEHPRELLALRVILPRIGSRLTPLLIDTILTGNRRRTSMAIHILGRLKDSTAAKVIGEKLRDNNWRIRSTAAEALLNMNAFDAKADLQRALHDSVDLVRGRSARAFARVADLDELQELITPLFNDTSQIVRYQIVLGLKDRGLSDSVARNFVLSTLSTSRTGYGYALLYPLAKLIEEPLSRAELFENLVADKIPNIRADAVQLAIEWNDPSLLKKAAKRRTTEKEPLVLYEIYRAHQLLNTDSTNERGE